MIFIESGPTDQNFRSEVPKSHCSPFESQTPLPVLQIIPKSSYGIMRNPKLPLKSHIFVSKLKLAIL